MEHRQIVDAMHRLDLLRRIYIRGRIREQDVHRGQFPILDYIVSHPGCTQAEIAESLYVTPASIACSAKRMENSGLIGRSADEADLRRNMLHATPKGEHAAKSLGQLFQGLDKAMFRGFSEEELIVLYDMHRRMIANIAGQEEDRPVPLLIRQLSELEEK